MSIINFFYNQQKAAEINSIINNNFDNVSRYIPVNFDSLTTIERLNLTDDWKSNGKLVYDIDEDKIYMWNGDVSAWMEHLLNSKDIYARALAEENRKLAFTSVEITDDYEIVFKNALGEVRYNPILTASKIQYNSESSVFEKITALNDKDVEQDTSLGTINSKIGSAELVTTDKTLTGAINELHQDIDITNGEIQKIIDGSTLVENANNANTAQNAKDSEKLGGQLPEYYAKQSDMTNVTQIANNNSTVNSQQDIKIQEVEGDISLLEGTIASQYQEYLDTKNIVGDNVNRLDVLDSEVASLKGAIIPKGAVSELDIPNANQELTQYIYDIYYTDNIYKGKTTLTEGNEQAELTQYIQDTFSVEPEDNWTVLDDATQNAWRYSGTETTWNNLGKLISTGWAVRDNATSDMWVYEEDTSSWIDFGSSFDIVIASTTEVGVVKASDDVVVASGTGVMSVPKLNDKSNKSDAITTADLTDAATGNGVNVSLKTIENVEKKNLFFERKALAHKISSETRLMTNRNELHFLGFLEITDDEDNDRTIIKVLREETSLSKVQLVDEDYTLILTESLDTYTSPVLAGFNKETDVVKLFMNGAYISKANYTITISDTNVATVVNLNHDTMPWKIGWELLFLVTRVVPTINS